MKRMGSPTPTLSSTSCCSWHHSTSWWRSLTGTGTVKLMLLRNTTGSTVVALISDQGSESRQFFIFPSMGKLGNSAATPGMYMDADQCHLTSSCFPTAPTPTMRRWPAGGHRCGWRSAPVGSALLYMCGPLWLHWSWWTEILIKTLSIGTLLHLQQCSPLSFFSPWRFPHS